MRRLTPRETAIVAAGAALAVLIPLYLLVFLPRLTMLRVASQQVQVKTRDLAALEQIAARLPATENAHATAVKRMRTVEQKIPRAEIPDLVVLLGRAIDASGIQLIEITFPAGQGPRPLGAAGTSEASLTEVPMTLRVRGTFGGMVTFMRKVEALPRLVTVQTLEIADDAAVGSWPGGSPTLGITIGLRAVALR